MFTGLIEEIGRIRALDPEGDGARLILEARLAAELTRGESIAIDGACLTVEARDEVSFSAFASGETLRRTTLGGLRPGSPVNLERALAVGDRLGGHWVQGHVEAMGTILRLTEEGLSHVVTFSAPDSVLPYLVEKGSIAVDGISLTVANLEDKGFTAWIVPETWSATTLGRKGVGDPVNLECDLIAKYVFRYLQSQQGMAPDAERRDASLNALLQRGGWTHRSSTRGR